MKRILLIGNGAREHVIAETLKKSSQEVQLFVIGKALNPGIQTLSEDYQVGNYMDHEFVTNYAQDVDPDFVFIGPDDPIGSGLADSLLEYGYKSVAPLKLAAQLESSKGFTRALVENHNIPGNPKFKIFTSSEGIREFMEELDGQFVVKYDGLKGGKGVKVVGDHLEGIEDGYAYAVECLEDADQVVIEEKFVGQEFSLISFADGVSLAHMPTAQDHKRAYDGDEGPNTGGMGTYSDSNHLLPFITEGDVEEAKAISEAVLDAVRNETGVEFKGIMYGGFIATKNGVRLIEYNARFGDPEAMNLLPLLKTDFVSVCEAIIEGNLSSMEIEFAPLATVCKYVVPEGYPTNSKKGEKIEVAEVPDGVQMYYGSIDKREDGLYLSGSRAIAFVGIAPTIAEAEAKAAAAVVSVSGPVFYRTDIGTKEVIQKKVEFMKNLRS